MMPNTQEINQRQNIEPADDFEAQVQAPAAGNADGSPVYAVLKAYFFTPKRGDIWGAFCFLFNGSTGDGMESVFWVTRALTGPAIDVTSRWRDLTKSIPAMGAYERTITEKLKDLMLEIFTSSVRIALVEASNTEEKTLALGEELRDAFERTTHYFLDFKIKLEKLSTQNLLDAGVLSGSENSANEKRASSDGAKTKSSFEGTIVSCLPIVDPVHGKPVSELVPGDMLDVKLEEGAGAGNLVQKYLESTSQDSVFPIESIERQSDEKTYVFLTINDELRGLVTVTKDLRLRTVSSDSGSAFKFKFNIDTDNVIFVSTVLVSAVVIGFIIRLLLF
ncbi:hypothetical protein FACS1894187_15330 [Synergistales bacterium]|nr:hypothetical protein FACS1894187_15330 [Synergistales bacterium]